MGMPEAIKEVFPNAKHQRCLVHIQRNISQNVRVKDRTEICDDFRNVYNQETKEKTFEEFDNFVKKWQITYPHLIKKSFLQIDYLNIWSFPCVCGKQ